MTRSIQKKNQVCVAVRVAVLPEENLQKAWDNAVKEVRPARKGKCFLTNDSYVNDDTGEVFTEISATNFYYMARFNSMAKAGGFRRCLQNNLTKYGSSSKIVLSFITQ